MCQVQLRTITIIAEWYSLLFGMLCIAADIYYILLQTCQVDYPGGSNSTVNNSIALFHNQYILGDSCLIEKPRFWYDSCNNTDNSIVKITEYPGSNVTSPEHISYWVYTHFGINILWLVSILLLMTPISDSNKGSGTNTNYNTERNQKSDRTASNILLPWILVTWIVLVFNLVAGAVFGLDISYPFKATSGDTCSFKDEKMTDYLISTLIMPLYFSWGVIFWVILVVIWILLMTSRSRFYGKDQMKKDVKNKRNRNLSETPSNVIQTLESRFDRQERLENEEDNRNRDVARTEEINDSHVDDDYVYKKQLRYHDAREQVISQEWSYTNDGFEGEPEQRPISLTRKPSLKPESPDTHERLNHQPGPSTASQMQRRRTISKSGSETSHRLSSKPSSPAPFIPKEDYPIPRAELSDRRPNARSESDVSDGFDSGKEYVPKSKSRAKMMRTQSGRAVGATEYLKGYKPNQDSLPE